MTKLITLFSICILFLSSCGSRERLEKRTQEFLAQSKIDATALMEKHLEAVANKDLATLKGTLSPEGKMQLMLPNTEIMDGVEKYVKFHEEWFKDTSWTFETKILNAYVGLHYGIFITEQIYREPERDGKPYFNRMAVSYGLERVEGQWYVITDHCTSIEKSTDKK